MQCLVGLVFSFTPIQQPPQKLKNKNNNQYLYPPKTFFVEGSLWILDDLKRSFAFRITKRNCFFKKAKKNPIYPTRRGKRGLCKKSLAMSYFRIDNSKLSSALSGFTSEFEMGSGGSHSLLSPGKLTGLTSFFSFFDVFKFGISKSLSRSLFLSLHTRSKSLGCYMIKPHDQLVLVSFMHYCTSTSSLSTL